MKTNRLYRYLDRTFGKSSLQFIFSIMFMSEFLKYMDNSGENHINDHASSLITSHLMYQFCIRNEALIKFKFCL